VRGLEGKRDLEVVRRQEVCDMSVEDLGTRELGQVRSQRLDEVSFFCPFQFIFFVSTVVCFSFPYS
jgi:hypothetical protein